MRRKAAIIAYDVQCNKKRRQVFRTLRQWKLDAQYSVFECKLTPGEAEELFLQLCELIDESTDSLLLAWLDPGRRPQGLTRCSQPGFKIPVWYGG